MSIEAIKKALKKVYIGEWYISGVKTNGLSVVHNAADSSMFGITAETFEAEYICAANPFAVTDLISEIDRLQREKTALKIDASNHAADAETARRERETERRRAEAAEAEVKRLEQAIKNMTANKIGFTYEPTGERVTLYAPNPNAFEIIANHPEILSVVVSTRKEIERRTALASTGGDHHGN